MDKVSPDFGSNFVETRSWTVSDRECEQNKEQDIEISTSPTSLTCSSQIAEAHSVVDIDSIPVEEESVRNESDCSVAEVFTPRLSTKQEDESPVTIQSPSVESVQQAEDLSLHGTTYSVTVTQESDMQPPSKKPNIATYPVDEANSVDQMQTSAEANPTPMLFGSFVAPGKADPNIVVSLEGAELWHQFYQAGTEMIITKSGR